MVKNKKELSAMYSRKKKGIVEEIGEKNGRDTMFYTKSICEEQRIYYFNNAPINVIIVIVVIKENQK
jgi:hypothetical protein